MRMRATFGYGYGLGCGEEHTAARAHAPGCPVTGQCFIHNPAGLFPGATSTDIIKRILSNGYYPTDRIQRIVSRPGLGRLGRGRPQRRSCDPFGMQIATFIRFIPFVHCPPPSLRSTKPMCKPICFACYIREMQVPSTFTKEKPAHAYPRLPMPTRAYPRLPTPTHAYHNRSTRTRARITTTRSRLWSDFRAPFPSLQPSSRNSTACTLTCASGSARGSTTDASGEWVGETWCGLGKRGVVWCGVV